MGEQTDLEQAPGLTIIPADQVTAADKADVTLNKTDGVYVLQLADGVAVPKTIALVDAAGNAVASYEVQQFTEATAAPTGARAERAAVRPAEYIVLDFTQDMPVSD